MVHHGMHKCDPGKDVVIDFMKLKTVFTLISTKMLFRFFSVKVRFKLSRDFSKRVCQ